MPHSPYYGTADATPLWLILLSEYWRFTGDDALVRARWQQRARRARLDRSVRRPRRRWLRRVRDALVAGPRQPVLEGLVGRRAVRGRTIPTCRSPPPRSRATSTTRSSASRSSPPARARRRARDAPSRRGRLAPRPLQPRLLDRRSRRLLRGWARRRQTPDRLADLEHRASPLVRIVSDDRAALVAEHLLSDRLFSGWGVRTLPRDDAATTRSATTSARSGRTTTRSSRSASLGTASETRPTGSRSRNSRPRHSPATGSPRRSQASSAR